MSAATNVLAVISKAIFEKEARSGGQLLGVGDVWPTALYASGSPHLSPLASGGTLFLVTVRPGDRLWLVGVLRAPKKSAKGWAASANTMPIRDVSALVRELRFASGKGVTAEPGKLGMSLQTPRALTDADVALLRGDAAETLPAKQSAPLTWRLENKRRRKSHKSLTATEKELLGAIEGELEESEEFDGCELFDVIETATGKPVALLALWPFGSGVVVELATKALLGDVTQHSFDAHGDRELRARLAAAYAEARARLKISESVDFTSGSDTAKRTAQAPAIEATLDEVRAMRAELAADPDAMRSEQAQKRLLILARQVLDFERYRPVPARRVFELSEIEREMLELLREGAERAVQLWPYGLPNMVSRRARQPDHEGKPDPLARWLGHAPPEPLDETIEVEGRPHPIGCLFHDAIHGLREVDDVLRLVAPLSLEKKVDLVEEVLVDPTLRLSRVVPESMKELRTGTTSKETRAPQNARRAALRSALLEGLGDDGEIARRLLARYADWARTSAPSLRRNPQLVYDETPLLSGALLALAKRARARGEVLDPSHDALLSALALASYTTASVAEVLALLPIERARRIACAQLALIAQFPSDAGAAAAARMLETNVDGGPYTTKLFSDAVAALGERMRPYLADAKKKVPARAALITECLAVLDRSAVPKKSTKRKKT